MSNTRQKSRDVKAPNSGSTTASAKSKRKRKPKQPPVHSVMETSQLQKEPKKKEPRKGRSRKRPNTAASREAKEGEPPLGSFYTREGIPRNNAGFNYKGFYPKGYVSQPIDNIVCYHHNNAGKPVKHNKPRWLELYNTDEMLVVHGTSPLGTDQNLSSRSTLCNLELPLNPLMSTDLKHLYYDARQYERFRFEDLVVHYRPVIGNNVNGANVIGFLPDPSENFTNRDTDVQNYEFQLLQLENHFGTFTREVISEFDWRVPLEVSPLFKSDELLFIRPNGGMPLQDYVQGRILKYYFNMFAGAAKYGRLYLSYKCTLVGLRDVKSECDFDPHGSLLEKQVELEIPDPEGGDPEIVHTPVFIISDADRYGLDIIENVGLGGIAEIFVESSPDDNRMRSGEIVYGLLDRLDPTMLALYPDLTQEQREEKALEILNAPVDGYIQRRHFKREDLKEVGATFGFFQIFETIADLLLKHYFFTPSEAVTTTPMNTKILPIQQKHRLAPERHAHQISRLQQENAVLKQMVAPEEDLVHVVTEAGKLSLKTSEKSSSGGSNATPSPKVVSPSVKEDTNKAERSYIDKYFMPAKVTKL